MNNMSISFETMRYILDFFTMFEVSQACLLIFILLTLKKNRRANIFFALFIFILSSIFFSMFLHANEYIPRISLLTHLSVPAISVIGVLIYFYTSLMTGRIEKFRFKSLSHFLIYVFMVIISFVSFILLPYEREKYIRIVAFVVIGTGLANSLVYIIISFEGLRKYYSQVKSYFSDIEKYDMNWLVKLTLLSLLFFLIWNFEFWLTSFGIIERNPLSMLAGILLLTVIIYATAYYLINKPDTIKETKEMLDELKEENVRKEKEKYAKQNIDEIKRKEYLNNIREYMEKNKPYLNENINIKELASLMNIPSHHLSIVINDTLNMNFYKFINEYRIKEAIRIFEDPTNSDANILSVAYSCGFNSKSTFNSVFKNFTGQTPSEYRNSILKKSRLVS